MGGRQRKAGNKSPILKAGDGILIFCRTLEISFLGRDQRVIKSRAENNRLLAEEESLLSAKFWKGDGEDGMEGSGERWRGPFWMVGSEEEKLLALMVVVNREMSKANLKGKN